MKNTSEAFSALKNKGARMTTAREGIVKVVFQASAPISAISILSGLDKAKVHVNKTTVYRELSFLVQNEILKEVYIKPGITHYESAFLPHHHHLVCEKCGGVEAVDCILDEKIVSQKAGKKGFVLKNHKLELYGSCVNCA